MENRKTFFAFVIPSVLAFALSGVYTIVDGFFVGNSLGDIGLAAITVGYPIAAFIQALGTGIGLSGAIRFSILGAQEREKEQQECFTASMFLLLMMGILMTAALMAGLTAFLRILGAKGEVFSLTMEYAKIIVLGTIFQIFATGLVPFIRNLNGASFAMGAMITGFLTNIVLDCYFVWILGWGMAGAAWATVIGQGMTLLLGLAFLVHHRMKPHKVSLGPLSWHLRRVLKVAFAPFGLTFSPNITLIFMNKFLLVYGDEQSVAVFGCIAYITAIVYLLLQGVGDGAQPLISSFFGEDKLLDMKEMRSLAYKSGEVIAAACMIGLFLSRKVIGVLFGASAQTNSEVSVVLIPFLLAFPLLAFVRITTAYFYATEKNFLSYLLIYAEPMLLLLFLLLLPLKLGLLGVWIAMPAAQAVTFVNAFFAKRAVDRRTFID